MKLSEKFSLEVVALGYSGVDKDEGILAGVKIIEKGSMNDSRPYYVDDVTLQQVVELGNRSNKGLKVRWTHGDNVDAMGTHLGRATGFRRDGDCVRADVRMAPSAYKSPKGDLAGYVLSLAEEDSESLGMSVAGMLDGMTMNDDEEGGVYPLRFSNLYSADVVADPAATRGGLFSIQEEKSTMTKEELGVDVSVSVKETSAGELEATPVEPGVESGAPESQTEAPAEMQEEETPVDEAPEGEAPVAEAPAEGDGEPVEAEAEDKPKELSKPLPEEDETSSEKRVVKAGAERYIEAFGKQDGSVWFLEGRDIVDCFAEKLKAANEELVALNEQLSKYKELEAAGAFAMGEPTPVEGGNEVELSATERHEKNIEKRVEQCGDAQSARWGYAFGEMLK